MLYDIIIAGAGPAGATCARACARQGLSVLLLERGTFPRPKPCGGAVSEQGLSLLDAPLPPGLIERECFGISVHYGNRRAERRKAHRIAVVVDRERFDQHLAERARDAGVELREAERVREIASGAGSVRVLTERGAYEGKFVVGADGAQSVVARSVRPGFGRDEMMAALVGTVPAGEEEIAVRCGGLLEMHYGIAPFGYGWVFPRRKCYSVGIMGLASQLDNGQHRFAEFVRSVGLPVPPARGHTIPLGGRRRPLAAGRIILAGDAAGFADPFHGEGISYAILSGLLAADAVKSALDGKGDAGTRYDAACDRLIRKNLSVALGMMRMLERYPGPFQAVFLSDTGALDRYLEIAAGAIDYAGFRRWLMPRLPGYLAAGLLRRHAPR